MENKICLNNNPTLKEEQINQKQSDFTNKKLMEAWLAFCKNFSNKTTEEIQGVLTNIILLHEDLITRGVFAKESYEIESDSEKYFITSFSPELIKHLLSHQHKDLNIRILQRDILQIYLKIFAGNMENPKLIPLFKAVGEIFDQDKCFYKSLEGKDASETFLEQNYQIFNKEDFDWRISLKEGDKVDYLLRDTLTEIKTIPICSSWTQAEIIFMDDKTNNLSIRLLGSGGLINNISLYSCHLLPVGTLSTDFEWRESLREGDEIDYLDLKSWYRSTVVDTADRIEVFKQGEEVNTYKSIKYGLRIYRQDGRLTDRENRKYFGWSEEYDKYISVHDPRIRRPNEFSKVIYNYHLLSLYPIEGRKFNEMETFIPFEFDVNKFFMIPRKNDSRNIDLIFYSITNKFCNDFDGLNKMINILQNYSSQNIKRENMKESPSSSSDSYYFDLFNLFVDILYLTNNCLHIKFFSDFFKNFLRNSFEVLKKFCRIETSNFKRDRLESSFRKIKDIMARVYVETDVNLIYDSFVVEFGLELLKYSKILQKRILGLKLLTDVLNEVLKNSSTMTNTEKHYMIPFLTAKVMHTDNENKDIFDYLYDNQTHSEILQKSPEFLKALFTGRVLTSKNFLKILSIANSSTDQEIKTVIHKGIIENVGQLGCDLQIFLIKYIIDIPIEKLSKKDIDIIIATFKSLPSYEKDMASQIFKFFSTLILYKFDTLSLNLYHYMIDEWINFMKSNEMRIFVTEFVSNITHAVRNDSKFDFIRGLSIMTKLIFAVYNLLEDEQKELLNVLLLDSSTEANNGKKFYEKEDNLIGIALAFLNNYHVNAKNILQIGDENNNKKIKDVDNYVFSFTDKINHSTHKEVMSTIIEFLGIFHCLKYFSFSNNQIDLLYKLLIEDSLSVKDSNIFFKWLKEAEDKNAIPKETFQKIFVQMIENENLQFSNISLDLFDCLWNIFATINKKMDKIEINEYKVETTYGVSNTGATLISRSFNPEKKGEVEMKCLIENPDELLGIELIWKMVISCLQTSEVGKKAKNYFLKLFFNNDLDSEKRGNLWKKLLDRAIKTIKLVKGLSAENKITKIEKRIKIVNSLNIIKSLIEETEKKGTAGCISHSSILKNTLINLKITNMISGKISQAKSNSEDKIINLKVYANTTLWDLKNLIAKKIGIILESIKFVSTNLKEMTDMDHGKTLNELNFKTNEILSIVKNPILDQIPKVSLVKNGELSEKAIKAFSEIFECFSTNGFMSKEQSTQFIFVAIDSNETIKSDDSRVKGLFDMYDNDKDELIDLKGFLKFYRDSIVELKKANTVWENLRCFNYRNDLKRLNEPLDEYNTEINMMPRFILSKSSEYFYTIFHLQDEDEAIATEASKLLSIISTNPSIFKEILMIKNNFDWERHLDVRNPFKLLYSLQIIESFFEEFETGDVKVNNEPYEFKILEEEIECDAEDNLAFEKVNLKVGWIERFLTQGGINHIIDNIFMEIKNNSRNKLNSQFKNCLNLSLKILRTSLSILFRARNKQNSKDEAILFLRKESFSLENYLNYDEKTNESFIENLFDDKKEENKPNQKKNESESPNIASLNVENKKEENLDKDEKKENKIEEELVEIINNKYGDSILKRLNFQILAHRLISIAFDFSFKSEGDQNIRSIFNNSINLLSLIVVSQDDITNFLEYGIYSFKITYEYVENDLLNSIDVDFEKFILCNLLLSSIWVRSSFKTTLKNLAENLINLKEFSFTKKLLEICLKKITSLDAKEKSQCSYFFEILEILLENYFKVENQLQSKEKIDYGLLGVSLVEILNDSLDDLQESIIIGYLNILGVIVKNRDNEYKTYLGCELKLVDILVDRYLIYKQEFEDLFRKEKIEENKDPSLIDPNSNKFKALINKPTYNSIDSRKSIFSLLLNLITDNPQNLLKLFDNRKFTNITDYLSKLKSDKKLYNPITEKRSSHGFCGLKNLSAICYMLSIIQQFFHMPILRYALMQSNDGKQQKYTNKEKSIDDNVLHQLQRMFVHMELTNRGEFWPTDFCYSFKGPDGQPTNVYQHQDTSEFLGKLFDILESSLKNTEFHYILQSIFLGKICSQLICKTCKKIRDNFEDFYSLSLEVKNMKTLSESFEKFISEDHISDYFCDNCKKNVSVIKRASFSELPNVVLINLQRIHFNLDTLTNEKLNSRLEFPKRINLRPYCTETITKDENFNHDAEFYDRIYPRDESYYEYELVGVVVHMGTADWGHYYSTINVKRDGISDKMNYDPKNENDVKKWLTFNDSSVSSFLLKNLEEECFGGNKNNKEEKEDDNIWGVKKQKSNDWENNKNAYVLVYERIKKNPLKMKSITKLHKIDMSQVVVYDDETKYKVMKTYDIFNLKEENSGIENIIKMNNSSGSEPNSISNGLERNNTITDDKISLDCENTAVSRAGDMTSAVDSDKEINGGTNICNRLFYDESKKEYNYYIPYYKLTPLIPTNYFQEVTLDNMHFINDQKIFSKQFSDSLEILSLEVLTLFKNDIETKRISEVSKNEIFTTLIRFVFDILSKSNFRDNLSKIVENLGDIMNLDLNFSEIVINHLFSNRDKLINDIIFSTEEAANSAYKNLILRAILINFNKNSEELRLIINTNEINDDSVEKPVVIKFLDFFYSLIPTDASKSWTKICTYLEIYEHLALSNNELILSYMFKKETIYRLIDFMLGKESPYYIKGETRTEMGNKTVPPKFAPLINTVSELARHSFTEGWTEKDYLENPDEFPSTLIRLTRIFKLSDKDLKCLTLKNFYKKAIKDSYNNRALSRLLAHLMFNNFSFSKKRVYMLIQSINEASSISEAKDVFDLLFNVISLYDKFSLMRLEWIFGIPQINVKTNNPDYPSLPDRDSKYGEKIIRYLSPLTYKTTYESLTERVISKFQSSVEFINILNYLFALVLKKSHVFSYFDSIPHPRKDKLLYKDYLFELANEEISRILNITNSGSKFESGIKGMTKVMEIYDEERLKNREVLITNDLKPFNSKILFAFAPRYKYGNIIREHISNIQFDNINDYNIYCLQIDYDVEIIRDGLNFESENENYDNIIEYKIAERSNSYLRTNNQPIQKTDNLNSKNQMIVEKEDDIVEEQQASDIKNTVIKEYNELDEDIDRKSTDAVQGDFDDFYNISLNERPRNNSKYHYEIQQKSKNEDKKISSKRNSDFNNNVIHNVYSDYNYQKILNEESYLKDNLNKILNYENFTRTLPDRFKYKSDRITVSAIKRFIILNNSEKEYKIRCSFSSNDDFINTYMPASELIVSPKKNSLATIFTFAKEDINLPWNEISVDVYFDEDGESVNGDNEIGNSNGKIIKKSNSYDNLKTNDAPIPLPPPIEKFGAAAEDPKLPDAETEGFPIECPKCHVMNFISGDSFFCKSCHSELFE